MIIAVVGPTASGKSDLALDIAKAIGAEIVSADAFQLYRGMDIGTAKVLPHQRRGIPHHQLDVLDITEEARVAVYQARARQDIADIQARGKPVVVVGGSGLYVRALLDTIEFPGTDPQVRAAWQQRLEQEGSGVLHAELARLDPTSADLIDPRNTRRLIRALETITITGRPYSATLPVPAYVQPTMQVGIEWPRDELFSRIEARTEAMLAHGLFDEVDGLVEHGLTRASTAGRAVGYAEVLDHRSGLIPRDEVGPLIARNTRRLVRRQLQWFARDKRVQWLEPGTDAGAVVEGWLQSGEAVQP